MLLNFIGQDEIHQPPLFETGKTYRYFTRGEVEAVANMFKKSSLKDTWDNLRHYFDIDNTQMSDKYKESK